MPTVSGSVRLRPTRIGLLVRPSQSSRPAVARFARLCACLWGGRFNPIVPVAKVLPPEWKAMLPRNTTGRDLADGYIRFFEPDVFVEAEEGLADELGIEPGSQLAARVLPLSALVTSETRGTDFAFGLNAFDVYKHLYERELQFVPKRKRQMAVFEKSDPGRPFFDVVFGVFPAQRALAYIRDAYIDAFEPKSLAATPEAALEVFKKHIGTPFTIGRYGIEREGGSGGSPTILFLDSSKTIDLIDYWNLTLRKRDVLPVDISWAPLFAPYLREVITRNHRPLPGNPHGVMIRTSIQFGRSVSEADAKVATEILESLPNGSFGYPLEAEPFWAKHVPRWLVKPQRVRLTAGEEDWEATLDETESSFANVRALAPEFADRFGPGQNHARWANVLQVQGYGGGREYATTYPTNIKNPDYPRITIGGSKAIVSSEGIVIPQQYKRLRNSLQLQRQDDAIIGWMKEQGIQAALSTAGRNAAQVIRSAGGLHGCRVLAHEGTLELLDRMAKSSHVSKDGTTAEFPDRTARVSEWKEVIGRRSGERPRVELSDFTDRNIIRLGLSVSCPRCEQENWYDLARVDYTLRCERCLREYGFPQGGLSYGDRDWRFRVVGPFTLPGYALGAYSTALTLRALSMGLKSGRSRMTWSTGLDLARGGRAYEVDLVAWYEPERMSWDETDPTLILGESKSFGAEVFHKKDIDRLRQVAEWFPGCCLVLAGLKRNLSPDERIRLRALAQWGRVSTRDGTPRAWVVVLTGNELFYTWSVAHVWEKIGGKHAQLAKHNEIHFGDMPTLADFTQQVYLDLPSLESERARRRKPK
jgi:hypothetical protein